LAQAIWLKSRGCEHCARPDRLGSLQYSDYSIVLFAARQHERARAIMPSVGDTITKFVGAAVVVFQARARMTQDLVIQKASARNGTTCNLTYASHSGFGNQVVGACRAAFIARSLGCRLFLPPVLEHDDSLGCGANSTRCENPKHMERLFNESNNLYRKRSLQFDDIFRLANSSWPVARVPQPFDWRKFERVALNRSLMESVSDDTSGSGSSDDWTEVLFQTSPVGNLLIGSAFGMRGPEVPTTQLFSDFNAPIHAAAGPLLFDLGPRYACVHLRQHDDSLETGATVVDNSLVRWVNHYINETTLAPALGPENSTNLFMMSGMPQTLVKKIMRTVCDNKRGLFAECLRLSDMREVDLGFPKDQQSYNALILELYVCSHATVIYLPSYGPESFGKTCPGCSGLIVSGGDVHRVNMSSVPSSLSRLVYEVHMMVKSVSQARSMLYLQSQSVGSPLLGPLTGITVAIGLTLASVRLCLARSVQRHPFALQTVAAVEYNWVE